MDTTIYDQKPLDDKGRPVKSRIIFRSPSGRFKRMLKRNQTIHTAYRCTKCGGIARFHKDIPIGKNAYEHNKWVCKDCGTILDREKE